MGQIAYGKFQAFDGNGDPLSGGKLYTYEAGTSTPKATYTDGTLGSANANPVVLNSRGEASIWGTGNYKLVLKDSADTTIWTVDNFTVIGDSRIMDADQDTKIQCEETSDEDLIRFDIAGTEQIVLDDGVLYPTTDNDVDLGKAANAYKIIYGKNVIIPEVSSAPTTAANAVAIYAKDVDGKPELFMRGESAGVQVPLTDMGFVRMPPGHIFGLTLSNDTDTEHDINVAAGICHETGLSKNIVLASQITKQIDVAWAAGDDAGGFAPSGTVQADTWYHVFIIRKDDRTIDAMFDSSLAAANIPSGYTEYRRLGSILTDGSANILNFSQVGDEFLWKDPPLDVDVADQGATAVSRTLSTPLGIVCWALVSAYCEKVGEVPLIYLSCLDVNDEAPSGTAAPLASIGIATETVRDSEGQLKIRTNTSSQIRSRGNVAAITLRIATLGWIDRRNQDS